MKIFIFFDGDFPQIKFEMTKSAVIGHRWKLSEQCHCEGERWEGKSLNKFFFFFCTPLMAASSQNFSTFILRSSSLAELISAHGEFYTRKSKSLSFFWTHSERKEASWIYKSTLETKFSLILARFSWPRLCLCWSYNFIALTLSRIQSSRKTEKKTKVI